ncbi:TetR/AcrR family transcriptional regulator [Maledivibacter halophilus]|uniref:Transcriptional regulator, TetR family n=1 Tax=Maledivibacter halophilus TaxID=36842 RepID=A0A1T5LLS4_9FIRM|nr:TetR/AcrR family transcriptional regulator [Maledivibacter halophilus]SKC76963.1 transcriptional regulator, TetR family [Maledivibacter halophilus]
MRVSKSPEERKKEIMEAAARLFLKKGFSETTMLDIANEVGVVKGLCYRYFSSKRELFDACLELLTDSFIKEIADILADKRLSVKERFQKMIKIWIENYNHIKKPLRENLKSAENIHIHDMIAMKGYHYLADKMRVFIQDGCKAGHFHVKNPEARARFIVFGIYGMRHIEISETDYFEELFDCFDKLLETDTKQLLKEIGGLL